MDEFENYKQSYLNALDYRITESHGRICYKHVWIPRENKSGYPSIGIAILWIPKGAKICENLFSWHKKRAEMAYVLDTIRLYPRLYQKQYMQTKSAKKKYKKVNKAWTAGAPFKDIPSITEYKKGEIVKPDKFTETPIQCAHGIHFFNCINSAIEYGCDSCFYDPGPFSIRSLDEKELENSYENAIKKAVNYCKEFVGG